MNEETGIKEVITGITTEETTNEETMTGETTIEETTTGDIDTDPDRLTTIDDAGQGLQ